MNILIELNHPAHFHLFHNFSMIMLEKGNKIGLVVKQKDVLLDLVKSYNNNIEIIRLKPFKENIYKSSLIK